MVSLYVCLLCDICKKIFACMAIIHPVHVPQKAVNRTYEERIRERNIKLRRTFQTLGISVPEADTAYTIIILVPLRILRV